MILLVLLALVLTAFIDLKVALALTVFLIILAGWAAIDR